MWEPDYVVLDSSELVRDIRLATPRVVILRTFCEQFGAQVVVPQVVRLEMAGNIETRVRDANKKQNDAAAAYQLVGLSLPGNVLSSSPADSLEAALHAFDARLEWLGATSVELPSVSHEEVIERLQEGRRPFGTSNKREIGYRDFLLWRNVLTLEGRVAFVTSNTKDFATEAEGNFELHPDLQDDISNGVSEVRLFVKLEDLAENVLEPRMAALDNAKALAQQLVLNSRQRRELEEFAIEHLQDEFVEASSELFYEGVSIPWDQVPHDALQAEVVREDFSAGVTGIRIVEVKDADSIGGEVELSLSCDVTVDVEQTASWMLWFGQMETVTRSRVETLLAAVEFTLIDRDGRFEPEVVSLQGIRGTL